VVIPVSDVDRAKQFYSKQLGFNVDVDNRMGESFRNVQLTPPGSACSVTIGTGLTPGLQLVVGDIQAARAELVEWGVEVSAVQPLRRVSGSTGLADRGTRSSSSRIPTATTGPCRRSPWPHKRSAAPANHSRVVIQPRTWIESRGMTVHEFEAVVGGGEGRLPLVELPFDVKEAYGTARPKVKATVNDVTLRTTVSVYGGRSYVGFRKEIQEAAGIRIGDRVRVRIEPDVEPREIEVPDDLARALKKDPAASQAFEGLSYTHRKEYARWVEDAKKPETRQRRVEKTIEMLRAGTKHP
jgi:hypothetical protein